MTQRSSKIVKAVLLGTLLVLGACQTTNPSQKVTYPTAAMPGLGAPADIRSEIYRPQSEGPFPAVIVLHGCGGVDNHHHAWAKTLTSWGYVAAVVDSFGSRGHGNLCATPTPVVLPKDRISDIIGMAEYLNTQAYVQKGSLGLIGFSHGGWTIMKALQEQYHLKEYGIRGAVAYYPYCDPRADGNIALPLLILMGAEDRWTPADRCRQLETEKRLKRPELVEMVFYPNTWHSFDQAIPLRDVTVRGVGNVIGQHKIGYVAASAEDAERRTRAYFDRLFKRTN